MAKGFKQVNANDIIGTSFFNDTIETTVNELNRVFCKGISVKEFTGKVQYEWDLMYENGSTKIPFTIYDWKEYRAFSKDEAICFHIGARNGEESQIALKAVKEALAMGVKE